MSENWQIALFTIVGGWLFVGSSAVTGMFFSMRDRLTRVETSVEFMIDATGRLAAKKLHSPDNHLGIDGMLDKYIESHQMTTEEWLELKNLCILTRSNPAASKTEKVYAEFLVEICEHKLSPKSLSHSKGILKI